ncbi:DUF2723 domain-containing protein [Candidatus Roizmanbacteria bacterium]|nr:DUF2723 domain-containing protein [Candidatus Roizmanbacteria bacterium]
MILIYYLLLFIFLLLNQSQYIFGGDSSEFSLVARTFSVAHPPGYPLYSILTRLINYVVPFYSTPWRVSLISSFSTILTSYILYKLLSRLGIPKVVSLFSATLFIFLFPIWQYAEIPEVFALHNLLAIAITFLSYRYSKKNHVFYLCLMAFLMGLSVSHHHIFVLFVPGWLYLLRLKWQPFLRKHVTRSVLFFIIISFALGVSFYVYSIIASGYKPPLDWENAKTFDGFIRLITRSSYGVFKAYDASSGNITNQIFDSLSFFIFALHDFRIIGLFFASIGVFSLKKKNKQMFTFFLITMLIHLFFLFYTNFSLSGSFTIAMYERFLIPIYLLFMIPFAFGITYSYEVLTLFSRKWVKNNSLKKILMYGYTLFLSAYLIIIAFQNYQVIKKIPKLDYFATYAKNLLDTVPKGAILFVGADNSYFTTAYYHFAEGYRKDVKFIFINILDKKYYRDQMRIKYPELSIPEPYDKNKDLSDFVKSNARFGVYLDNARGGTWKPYGLLWKYYETAVTSENSNDELVKVNVRLWNTVYKIPEMDAELKKILHLNVVQDHYINSYFNYSKLLFATGHIDQSATVVKNIISKYRKNDIKTKLILVNLLVYQKKCIDAKFYLKSIELSILYQSAGLLPSLKEYYEKCEINNPDLKNIDNIMDKSSDSSKTPLKEF